MPFEDFNQEGAQSEQKDSATFEKTYESTMGVWFEIGQNVKDAMMQRGWTEADIGDFDNALDEAAQNIIIHGGNFDIQHEEGEDKETYENRIAAAAKDPEKRSRPVVVAAHFDADSVDVVIQGVPGRLFDEASVPDPTADENLLETHGKGMKISGEDSDAVYYDAEHGIAVLKKFKEHAAWRSLRKGMKLEDLK